jgi:hypothetical protein
MRIITKKRWQLWAVRLCLMPIYTPVAIARDFFGWLNEGVCWLYDMMPIVVCEDKPNR